MVTRATRDKKLEKLRRKILRDPPEDILEFIQLRSRIMNELIPICSVIQGETEANQRRLDAVVVLMQSILPLIQKHQHRLDFKNRSYIELGKMKRLLATVPRDEANMAGLFGNIIRVTSYVIGWFTIHESILPSVLELTAMAAVRRGE